MGKKIASRYSGIFLFVLALMNISNGSDRLVKKVVFPQPHSSLLVIVQSYVK
jgi:hypothetical protein